MNRPENYVDEALAGMVLAYPNVFELTGENRRVVAWANAKAKGRVGVVTGGGFGHLPLFAGYVGEGLLDACAVGDVFAGPSVDSVAEAFRAADRGAGILAVIGNYGGDRMAFGMAADELDDAGVEVATVIGNDDVASASPDEADKRRGVAGMIFAFKVADAAAEAGWPLERTADVARRAVERCRTIGMAVAPCTIPSRGKPTFTIEEGTVEMGMGIHGEKGVWHGDLRPVDDLVDEMFDRVVADMPLPSGARVALLCNSLGATPLEELLIAYRRMSARIGETGASATFPVTGHYVTSMEMVGLSMSVLILDDELEALLRAPPAVPSGPDRAPYDMAGALTVHTWRKALRGIAERLRAGEDELNTLDAELGDGDLGQTIVSVAAAVEARIAMLPDDIGGALSHIARAISDVSGSSFSGLMTVGLRTAAKGTAGRTEISGDGIGPLLRNSIDAMIARGGAKPSDKTVIDGLAAIAEAEPGVGAPAAVRAALDAFRPLPCRSGRARLAGDRSVGRDDPGMVALLFIVEGAAQGSAT